MQLHACMHVHIVAIKQCISGVCATKLLDFIHQRNICFSFLISSNVCLYRVGVWKNNTAWIKDSCANISKVIRSLSTSLKGRHGDREQTASV